MKFGKQLRDSLYPEWRFHYLDYDLLKHTIKLRTQNNSYAPADESSFAQLIEQELDKVASFHSIKIAEITRRVQYCEAAVAELQSKTPEDVLVGSLGSSVSDDLDEEYAVVEAEINRVIKEVSQLQRFARLNYSGFVKIIKKHDKLTPFMLAPVFMVRLDARPFWKGDFEGMVLTLSRLYEMVRNRGRPLHMSASAGQSGHAQNFQRRTTKYWVHPDNVFELKCYILKYLPVLVFNAQTDPTADPSAVDPAITSVYFDNTSLDLYLGRLEKHENAEAIRLRWYGPITNSEIFVERKTHKEDWTGESSIKQRFPIKEKYVNDYIRGSWSVQNNLAPKLRARGLKSESDIKVLEQLAGEIQTSIRDKQLVPCMRTFYNRTAFQLPGDARVRISLDTQLTMIREDDFDGNPRALPNWRRRDAKTDFPFAHLPDADVCRFPYAVLEVKLQTQVGAEEPRWVRELIEGHLVEEVPKFSKFVHGCATLLEDRVRLLPFWLPQMDKDIRRPALVSGPGGGMHGSGGPTSSAGASRESLLTRDLALQQERNYPAPVVPRSDISLSAQCKGSSTLTIKRQQSLQRAKTSADDAITEASPLLGEEATATTPIRHQRRPSVSSTRSQHRHLFGSLGHALRRRFGGERAHGLNAAAGASSPPNKRIAVPVRVEPKVFFANERTFLSWIHFAVVLGGLALGLLNFGDKTGVIAGVLFTAIAMGIMIYALWLFRWRAQRIRNKEPGPYDDPNGPVALVVVIISAVLVNFWLKFTSVAY